MMADQPAQSWSDITIKSKGGSVDLSDWMTKDPVSVTPDTTVLTAAQIMKEKGIGSVLVEKDTGSFFHKKKMGERGQLLGIFTDSDIVRRIVAEDKSPATMKVKDVMTSELKKLYENSSIYSALEMLSDTKIKRIPVVNEKNVVAGIITLTDVLLALRELKKVVYMEKLARSSNVKQKEAKLQYKTAIELTKLDTVGHWMVPDVHYIQIQQKSIHDIAVMMKDNLFGALPVVDSNQMPVGMITDTDILRRAVAENLEPKKTPAEDIMTKALITVTPLTSMEMAMGLMYKNRCRRLIVIENNRLVGMISASDLMGAAFKLNKSFLATRLVDMMYSKSARN